MNKLISWSTRWPRTVVAVSLLIAAVAAVGTTRLRNEEDLLVFLPTDDPDVRLFQDVSRRFGSLRVAIVGVEAPAGEDVFSPSSVAKIQRATDAINNVRGRDLVLSMTNADDIIAGPLGAQQVPLVDAVPTNAAESRALRDKVLSREFAVGNFVSRDGRAALILAFLADPGTIKQQPGELRVEEQIRAVAERELAGMKIYYGGAPFAARAIYQEAQADVRHLSPVAMLVLLLVVIVAFRDPVGVALTVGCVAFSVLVVIGGMGWWGEKFTVASSALPVILFASGSSYAVHVLGRYYLLRATSGPAEAIREALRIVGPPLAIAAATTSVGFYSFVTTDVRPMRSFGIACGSGVLLCWLTSLTVVPAVVALFPRKAQKELELDRIGDALVAMWHWAQRHRRLLFVGALAIGALTVGPMLRVRVRMEPKAFFREGSEPWLADKFLDDHFGGSTFAQLWLTGDFDDPSTLRELARLEDFAHALPGVTQVSSVLMPITLATNALDGMPVLPWKRVQTGSLFVQLQGRAGIQQLITDDRHDVLVQLRMRGDASVALAELEDYVRTRLRRQPQPPSLDDLAERLSWMARAHGRVVWPRDLLRTLRPLAPPGLADEEWTKKRTEVVDEFLKSEEAPEMTPATRAQLAALAVAAPTGSAELQAAMTRAAPTADDGARAYDALVARLQEEQRRIAVARAVPLLINAAELPSDGIEGAFVRAHVVALADDLFVHIAPTEKPTAPLSARIAGEPILDRGFSRSVGDNQVRSLIVTVVCVMLLMFALFRSIRMALLSMWASLLTMALIFGVMGMLHVPIDLGTSLVAGIATGAGSDFAMHYLWYLRRQRADEVSRTVGPVMAVSILLVSLGFWVLALGKSPVMHLFGTLAGLSMFLSAFLTCLLVPAVLNKVEP